MCTMICERTEIEGSGKGRDGWFPLEMVNVSYDHPFNAPWEYGVNIDFVNQSRGGWIESCCRVKSSIS